jgi:glycosyltransferase involved in cell wall biosynthesis
VRVTGWLCRDDVLKELQRADLFVLPSLWEGMPLALVEAQCLGLPAVASNIVGNRDVLGSGASGFLSDSEEEFTVLVSRLLDEPELRQRMAREALRQRPRFDEQRLGPQTMDVYTKLLRLSAA